MGKLQNPGVDRQKLVKVYRQALAAGVALDKIEQKTLKYYDRTHQTHQVEQADDEQKIQAIKNTIPRSIRVGAYFLPIALILTGIVLVGSAVLPIVGYYLKDLPELRSTKLASPIPDDQVLDAVPYALAQLAGEAQAETIADPFVESTDYSTYSGPVVIDTQLDFTNLANWFDDQALSLANSNQVQDEYVLEIPKLGIVNANVKAGGTDLNESLIQYPGTAMPGQPGAPVIFGHSVLRQFYNPKESNPKRYSSIFSTIMTLKPGDKIYLKQGSVTYTYSVQDKTEVKPTDTYILAQRYDSRLLKLVTCVPEGTYLKRGVVTAVLVKE